MKVALDIHRANTALVVRVEGELDHHTSANVREMIDEELSKERPEVLVLNLAKLNFMDSSGLGVILGRYKAVSESGGQLVLCSLTKPVAKLLEMSGLFKILHIYEDELSALRACEVAS